MKKIAIGSILFLVAAAIFWSCNKDKLPSGNATKAPTTQALTSNCALSLSYEVETTSIEQPINDDDKGKLNTLEKISCEPHVSREAMSICIDDQGAMEIWENYLKPHNPYNRPSTALPNDLPQTASAHTANGVAEYFDETGRLLHTSDAPTQDLSGLIKLMKDFPVSDQDFQLIVDEADKNHALLFNKNGAVGIKFEFQNGYMVNIYDSNRKILIGTESYNAKNEIESQTIFMFDGDATELNLKAMHNQVFSTSAISHVPMKTHTYYEFEKFLFTKN